VGMERRTHVRGYVRKEGGRGGGIG